MSGHYEFDEDYGDPYWHPSSKEDELRMQLLMLNVQEIPRENIQYVGTHVSLPTKCGDMSWTVMWIQICQSRTIYMQLVQ